MALASPYPPLDMTDGNLLASRRTNYAAGVFAYLTNLHRPGPDCLSHLLSGDYTDA